MRFRFLAVLIAVLMVFALMPGQMASAAERLKTGDTCPKCKEPGMIYVDQYDNDQHVVFCRFCGYGTDVTGDTLFENHWGLDDDCVCDGCGATIHKWELSGGDFTWTGDEENGYTSAVAVFVCNASSESHTEIREAKLETKVTEPTCEEGGKTVYTATLSSADSPDGKEYVFSREAKEIAANGHTEVTDPEVPATCEGTGLTEGSHCSVCSKVLVKQEEIDALGHVWSDWIYYKREDGTRYKYRYCLTHGCSYREYIELDPIINSTYTVVDSPDGTKLIHYLGSKGSITITVKGTPDDSSTFDNFTGVLMDGNEVPANDGSGNPNYTSSRGSLILELQSSYLETLEAGKHTVTILFSDGDPVTAEFTVAAPKAEPEDDNPKTGDESSLLLWAIAAAAAACGIALALRRRQRV